MTTLSVFILIICLSAAAAFALNGAAAPARMSMLFGMGKKTANKNFEVGKGTANKGSYVPEGLTAAQYQAQLQAESAAAKQKREKFPKGKKVETLTEWMDAQAKKGNVGKDLLTKGHRMVKAKYPEFYVDKNEQIS